MTGDTVHVKLVKDPDYIKANINNSFMGKLLFNIFKIITKVIVHWAIGQHCVTGTDTLMLDTDDIA
jgi:hypothetical protein